MNISEKLKYDLLQGMDSERVFQKHVIDGPSHVFNAPPNSPDEEYHLRHEIASATQTSINDIIIIGSAKIGFSIKTTDFLAFDHNFQISRKVQDKSDVDIAIVNRNYFEIVSEEIYHLSKHFDKSWIRTNWTTNQYYTQGVALYPKYTEYFTRGWIRPDYIPNAYLTEAAWPAVCERWRVKLNRKVSVGIYSNWTYLKHYHMDHLETLRSKIRLLETA